MFGGIWSGNLIVLEDGTKLIVCGAKPSSGADRSSHATMRASTRVHSYLIGKPRFRDVSSRQIGHLLAVEHLPEEWNCFRGALRAAARLYALRVSVAMHTSKAGAAHHRPADPRIPRHPSNHAKAANHRRVPQRVCRPRGHREHPCAGDPVKRPTPHSLSRAAEDSPAACRHRSRY